MDFMTADRTFSTSITRWASVGPYYAMFPIKFAFDVVRTHSRPGEAVLDPFAGRGSSLYAAAATGRRALGIEINPVGWLYSSVKLAPSAMDRVLLRLKECSMLSSHMNLSPSNLPIFYYKAYSPKVLKFLLACQGLLKWRTSRIDATLMAFILVYLHGKREASLSNQMRDGKAMSPEYSIKWWRTRRMLPPDVDPLTFLSKRIKWRYRHGLPNLSAANVILGDSTSVLHGMKAENKYSDNYTLLFTSPPYCGVTNYHYDQWLRLWMLGQSDHPKSPGGLWQGKFRSEKNYKDLLLRTFSDSAKLMKKSAVIYVRTDARKFTFDTTIDVLSEVFNKKKMKIIHRPINKKSQTALFGDNSQKPGEIDVVMT